MNATAQLTSDAADEQRALMAEETALTLDRLAALWQEVVRLSREVPYCHGSRYSSFDDASREIAVRHSIPEWVPGTTLAGQHPDREIWYTFVGEMLSGRSQYAGD